jgi:iron(III) transport system ATP-binding protein
MGSNNKLPGRVTDVRNGTAVLEGDGWRLTGAARAGVTPGREGVGMIRLERIRVAEGPGDNRVRARLTTSMYLGDRWEHVFHLGRARLRAYGDRPLGEGEHWLELPARQLGGF